MQGPGGFAAVSNGGTSLWSQLLKGLAWAGEYNRLDRSFDQEWYNGPGGGARAEQEGRRHPPRDAPAVDPGGISLGGLYPPHHSLP